MLLTYHKETISLPDFCEDIQIDVDELPGTLETLQNSEMVYIFEVWSLQKVVTVQLEVFFQPLSTQAVLWQEENSTIIIFRLKNL